MRCVRLADSDKRKTVRALAPSPTREQFGFWASSVIVARSRLSSPQPSDQSACDLRLPPAPFRPSTTVPSRSAQTPTPPALLFVSCATARHWSHCHRSRLRALKAGSGAPSLAGFNACSSPPPRALGPASPLPRAPAPPCAWRRVLAPTRTGLALAGSRHSDVHSPHSRCKRLWHPGACGALGIRARSRPS
jgi:hypothetical protein